MSKQKGILEAQWCYEINSSETKLKERDLSLTGYRLPTETEVEYSMRAGSSTSRDFGETE